MENRGKSHLTQGHVYYLYIKKDWNRRNGETQNPRCGKRPCDVFNYIVKPVSRRQGVSLKWELEVPGFSSHSDGTPGSSPSLKSRRSNQQVLGVQESAPWSRSHLISVQTHCKRQPFSSDLSKFILRFLMLSTHILVRYSYTGCFWL